MRRQPISDTANPAAAKIDCLLISGAIAVAGLVGSHRRKPAVWRFAGGGQRRKVGVWLDRYGVPRG
jgi:hypothetical protein